MKLFSNRKVGWLLLLSILFIIIAISYWGAYNTNAQISERQKKIVELVEISQKVKIGDSAPLINSFVSLKKGKYTNDTIKKLHDDFEKIVMKRKITREEATSFRNRYTVVYEMLKDKNEVINEFFAVLIIIVIVITFFSLAYLSNILRDITGNPVPRENESHFQAKGLSFMSVPIGTSADVLPPYSLARTQLALWIAIIASVYAYAVFWDNLQLESINNTALLLMGIAGGTFAAGAILDTAEIEQNVARHQDYSASENFFKDILSDKDGVSIHRFQQVVWTVIAVFVYFYKYSNQPAGTASLPELDNTLLALTGISSATYLVLKARENIGQQKGVILEISLDINTVPQPLQDQIRQSQNGLKDTKFEFDGAGAVGVKPDPGEPKIKFIASVAPGDHNIKATWSGIINNTAVNLSGELQVTVEDSESKSITIQMI